MSMTTLTLACLLSLPRPPCSRPSPRADAPHIYTIKGARIVTAAGAPIASGTVVIRNGLIDAVGADVPAVPGAIVIEGAGLTVYPGLIDMGNSTGARRADEPAAARRAPDDGGGRALEARRRSSGPTSGGRAAARRFSAISSRLALARVSRACSSTPPGQIVKGQSALVNVVGLTDEPQIGNVGDYRRGLQIVRTPVALHVDFPGNIGGDGYPVSLIGAIAFFRQSLPRRAASAARRAAVRKGQGQRHRETDLRSVARRACTGARRTVAGRVRGRSGARDPARARHGAGVQARSDHHRRQRSRPDGGGAEGQERARDLQPELPDPAAARWRLTRTSPLRELRTRAQAPKVPGALEKAGVQFAFASSGLARAARLRPQRRARGQGRSPRRRGGAGADDQRGADRRRRRPPRIDRTGQDRQRHRHRRRSVRGEDAHPPRLRRWQICNRRGSPAGRTTRSSGSVSLRQFQYCHRA